jgi:hypothetical protein
MLASNGEVEGPRRRAQQALRVHTAFRRPRHLFVIEFAQVLAEGKAVLTRVTEELAR